MTWGVNVFCLSQVQTNAFTVIFDERFSIPMDLSTLDEYSLLFAAFGIDADERNISAGVADLKLMDLDLSIRPFNAWLYLQDVNKVSCHTVTRQKPQNNDAMINSTVWHFEAYFQCDMYSLQQ